MKARLALAASFLRRIGSLKAFFALVTAVCSGPILVNRPEAGALCCWRRSILHMPVLFRSADSHADVPAPIHNKEG